MTKLAWPAILLFMLPEYLGGQACTISPAIGFYRVSQTFYPGWSQTKILLITASPVARITGVSHHTLIKDLELYHVPCFY
jgi:hypothetical protein